MRLNESSSAFRSAPFLCSSSVSFDIPFCSGLSIASRLGVWPIGLIDDAGFRGFDEVVWEVLVTDSLTLLKVPLTNESVFKSIYESK